MKKYLGLILLSAACTLSAIDAGKNMPALSASKWYFRPAAVADEPLECTVLFDVNSENSQEMLRMLELLQNELQLPFTAVAVNVRSQTDSFVKANGPYSIGMAADDGLKTRNLLAENESLFPYAVLAQSGKVVWTGYPTELESVIGMIRAGKFSLSDQRRVESLRGELQMAIQSGLPHVVSSSADKILKISPSDRIAIQAKIMALHSTGKNAEATEFVRKVCAGNPQDLQLRIMELDLLLQAGDADRFVRAVEQFSKDFAKPESRLVNPVAYIIENAPFGLLMPQLALSLAQRAYDGAAAAPALRKSVLFAIASETLARVKAQQGDFAEAVRLQQEALTLRKGTRQESAAQLRLKYYQALQQSK